MIGCLRTCVRKQPIVTLYFEFEIVQLASYFILFVLFDSLHPINNLSVKQGQGLSGLNQYQARINVQLL